MISKYFTIETRLYTNQFPIEYYRWLMIKHNRILRIIFKLLQTQRIPERQLFKNICEIYHLDHESTRSLLKTAKGRLSALRQLKKANLHKLSIKIKTIKQQITKIQNELLSMKALVKDNQATNQQLSLYRKIKYKLWRKKQVYHHMIQRKQQMERKIKNGVYHVCWGSKKLFKAQYHLLENGFSSHKQWLNTFRAKRDSQVNYIGSSNEPYGNRNCQLTYDRYHDCFHLRIKRDIEYIASDGFQFFQIKNLQFHYLRSQLIQTIQSKSKMMMFRMINRQSKWYMQVIFQIFKDEKEMIKNTHAGVIGLDFNNGFISMSETDYYGNLIHLQHFPLHFHGEGNKADTQLQQVIAQIIKYAQLKQKPIAIERLDFDIKKARLLKSDQFSKRQYNQMLHTLDYGRYTIRFDYTCFRNNIALLFVNPAYTTQIAMKKYATRMKLNSHQGASYVIARRAQGYRDMIYAKNERMM